MRAPQHSGRSFLRRGLPALARSIPLVLIMAAAAPAQGRSAGRGAVAGITLEPGRRGARLVIRCTAPVRPKWRSVQADRVCLELPETSPGTLPAVLPLDTFGIRLLRARRSGRATRLE